MKYILNLFQRWNIKRKTGYGVFLLSQGKYDKALEKLNKILELDPENHMAWAAKGLTLAKLTKYGQAIVAYEKALSLKPPPKEQERLLALLDAAKHRTKNH